MNGANETEQERVAQLITTQTSVKLPAGILTNTDSYVFRINARKSSRSDPSAFNREGLPEYTATVLSAIQTP